MASRLSNSLDAGLRVWDINAFFEGESRCLKLMRGHKVGARGENDGSRRTAGTCCGARGVRTCRWRRAEVAMGLCTFTTRRRWDSSGWRGEGETKVSSSGTQERRE